MIILALFKYCEFKIKLIVVHIVMDQALDMTGIYEHLEIRLIYIFFVDNLPNI